MKNCSGLKNIILMSFRKYSMSQSNASFHYVLTKNSYIRLVLNGLSLILITFSKHVKVTDAFITWHVGIDPYVTQINFSIFRDNLICTPNIDISHLLRTTVTITAAVTATMTPTAMINNKP